MKRHIRFYQRLAVQLAFTVALVTSLTFAWTIWTAMRQERETLTRELTMRLLAKSRSLSLAVAGPLLRHDPELGLHPLVLRALEETPGLLDLVVLDSRRRIQGHRDVLRVGETLQEPRGHDYLTIAGLNDELVWLSENDLVVEQAIRHQDQIIGWMRMRASRNDIETTVQRAERRLVALGAVGTLVAALAVIALVSFGLRPLGELRRGVRLIGDGNLDVRIQVQTRNELGLFASLVNSMAAGLESAQVRLLQKERIDHELWIARELQSMLLPKMVKPAQGYLLEARYTPALEVSGDYYDVFPLGEHRLALAAADVSGKGVPGLMIMAMLRTALRSLASPELDPVDVLVMASERLSDSMKRGMFVTCVYGILDTRSHVFSYASAGHCPPATFGAHGVRYLPARGKPIGPFRSDLLRRSLRTASVELQPGDGLLLYTDGLVEALNHEGEALGPSAVLDILKCWSRSPSGSLVDVLVERLSRHRDDGIPGDDLSILALQRQGLPVMSTGEST